MGWAHRFLTNTLPQFVMYGKLSTRSGLAWNVILMLELRKWGKRIIGERIIAQCHGAYMYTCESRNPFLQVSYFAQPHHTPKFAQYTMANDISTCRCFLSFFLQDHCTCSSSVAGKKYLDHFFPDFMCKNWWFASTCDERKRTVTNSFSLATLYQWKFCSPMRAII